MLNITLNIPDYALKQQRAALSEVANLEVGKSLVRLLEKKPHWICCTVPQSVRVSTIMSKTSSLSSWLSQKVKVE